MPPLGKVRVRYEIRENPKGTVEVLLENKVVCQLPASEVSWRLTAGDVGVITVDLIAQRVDSEAIS